MKDHHKIRAWDEEEKMFYYMDDSAKMYGKMYHGDGSYTLLECDIRECVITGMELELCTGIKDKNGKLIYHGDRYRMMGNEGIVDRRIAAHWISLEDAAAAPHKLVEIIGTIHDKA